MKRRKLATQKTDRKKTQKDDTKETKSNKLYATFREINLAILLQEIGAHADKYFPNLIKSNPNIVDSFIVGSYIVDSFIADSFIVDSSKSIGAW